MFISSGGRGSLRAVAGYREDRICAGADKPYALESNLFNSELVTDDRTMAARSHFVATSRLRWTYLSTRVRFTLREWFPT
jgi:hypothetical protein